MWVKHYLDAAVQRIYLSRARTFQQMQRKTKAEKKGIERLGVGLARLADGQQTFWWSLNVVCNKSHRRLRACWRLGSNVITERRWVSHFSSHINFFYMLDCSGIDEPGSLRSPSKDPALPASDWLVFPTSIPKLCSSEALKTGLCKSKLQKNEKKSLSSCNKTVITSSIKTVGGKSYLLSQTKVV